MVGWWKPPPQDPSAPTCPDVGSVYPFDIPDKTHINSLNVHQLRNYRWLQSHAFTLHIFGGFYLWGPLRGMIDFIMFPHHMKKSRRYQWLDGGNHRLKIPAPQHVLMLAQFYPFDIPDKTHINSLNVHQLRNYRWLQSHAFTLHIFGGFYLWGPLRGMIDFIMFPHHMKKTAATNGWMVETTASRSQRPNMSWCWLNFTHSISQIKHI